MDLLTFAFKELKTLSLTGRSLEENVYYKLECNLLSSKYSY